MAGHLVLRDVEILIRSVCVNCNIHEKKGGLPMNDAVVIVGNVYHICL